MIVYRIARSEFIRDLSGKGAMISGGRWNSKGHAVLYTSASVSLAILEVLVHTHLDLVPTGLMTLKLQVPDASAMKRISLDELPQDWRTHPAPYDLREMGDRWLSEGEHLGLWVPSAVNPCEENLLLNPMHPAMREVIALAAEPLLLDTRLWGRPTA